MKNKVLVLGIGNRLMMDDGIGVYIVEELAKRNSQLEILYVAGETDVGFCMGQIMEASFVIIVDAACIGKEYGEVFATSIQQALQNSQNTVLCHEFDLLNELKIQHNCIEGLFIGIEIYEINYGMQLSDVLKDKFEGIVDKVENIITQAVI